MNSLKLKISKLEDSMSLLKQSNIRLETENNLLKTQITFMERLLLKTQSTAAVIDEEKAEVKMQGPVLLQRQEIKGKIGSNLHVLATLFVLFAVSFMSETTSPDDTTGNRILQECRTWYSRIILFFLKNGPEMSRVSYSIIFRGILFVGFSAMLIRMLIHFYELYRHNEINKISNLSLRFADFGDKHLKFQ